LTHFGLRCGGAGKVEEPEEIITGDLELANLAMQIVQGNQSQVANFDRN